MGQFNKHSGFSWSDYWTGVNGGSTADSPVHFSHPEIKDFWSSFFTSLVGEQLNPSFIDIACGDGALVDAACSNLGSNIGAVHCLDVSLDAVQIVISRRPNVNGIVAHAECLPFAPESFDIVTSQFGIEYAGTKAILEASALVAPGGFMGLILHHRGGIIYKGCREDAEAIAALIDSNFLPLAVQTFEHALLGDEARFYDSELALGRAFSSVDALLRRFGPNVAGNTVLQVFQTVAQVHDNLRSFNLQKIVAWLTSVNRELPSYLGRVESMCASALDEESFGSVCSQLSKRGFSIERAGALMTERNSPPRGWMLVVKKK